MHSQQHTGVFRRIVRLPSLRFFRNLVNRIAAELRRHGVKGFTLRVPYYLRHAHIHFRRLITAPPAGDGHLFDATPIASRPLRLHPELANIPEKNIDASISVVIPTLNAGCEFSVLLRKLYAQRGLHNINIVIVDSGSTDATVPLARAAGCTVIEIPPEQFSHSFARNTGADVATGDYLIFMVQDAYPIGDYWAYGILKYLLDHSAERMVAASCAEYSRSDSDVMYDAIIHTHYSFLGCITQDRIGEFKGNDHTLLRSYGQLSDVACLISRDIFQRYRYRGSYAEDLDLGIRLIKDGYRIAMLASVKVIHSHNRPAYYYLKRSFVDTAYLVTLFEDYVYPKTGSPVGLILGIVSTAAHLSEWLQHGTRDENLNIQIKIWRRSFAFIHKPIPTQLGDEQLDTYIDSLAARFLTHDARLNSVARNEARAFVDAFFARLEHFNHFAAKIYPRQDSLILGAINTAICKCFASAAGSALGFMYMDSTQSGRSGYDMAETIKNELQAGI